MQQSGNRISRITPTMRGKADRCRSRSAFGQGKDHCLCVVLKPAIILGQGAGVLPISRHPESCTVTSEWRSIPMALNIAWAVSNVIGCFIWYPRFYEFLHKNFTGTDFYTYCIAVTVQFISSVILFFSGRVTAVNFAKAWPKLHDTVNEMGLPGFTCVKYSVYVIPGAMLCELVLSTFLLLGEMCYDDYKLDSVTVQLRVSGFFANFIPNLSTLTFALLIKFASVHFRGINEQLTELQVNHFNRFEPSPARTSEQEDVAIVIKLARLRILHENLCEVVRKTQAAFGLQMEAIFAATSVSFLMGIYNLILDVHSIVEESEDKVELFFRISSTGLMPVLAAARIFIIVMHGQALTNNANEAGHILSGFNIINASEEAKIQVRKFLDKIGMFPVQLTAHGIIELGASFIGPATGNLITYILVMMQFRLDDDPNPSTAMDPAINGTGSMSNLWFLSHN